MAIPRSHTGRFQMSRTLTMLFLLSLSFASFAGQARPYVLMQEDLAELKRDFNDAADQVRLVFIVGPT